MKKILKIIGIILGVIIGFILILIFTINYFFFNINQLPEGQFLSKQESPNGDYSVKSYVSKSGATVADAVRVEVIYHQKKDRTKNIYWGYRESEAEIHWINNDTVSINGIELDVRKDVYDFRKD